MLNKYDLDDLKLLAFDFLSIAIEDTENRIITMDSILNFVSYISKEITKREEKKKNDTL